MEHNAELPWGALPGALAESVRCTMAVGPGAAVAAARPFGRVDRYVGRAARRPEPRTCADCVLSIVDLGTVAGTACAARAAAARRPTRRWRGARRPPGAVAGDGGRDWPTPSDRPGCTSRSPTGPGYDGGWLTSPSTGRAGYLQLVDLAADRAGRARPSPGPPGSSPAPRRGRIRAARPTWPRRSGRSRTPTGEAAAQRRRGPHILHGPRWQSRCCCSSAPCRCCVAARGTPVRAAPGRAAAGVRWAGSRCCWSRPALAVPAALAADLVPWWRTDGTGPAVPRWPGVAVLAPPRPWLCVAPLRRRTLGRWPSGAAGGRGRGGRSTC